jgi:hypothetical protein
MLRPFVNGGRDASVCRGKFSDTPANRAHFLRVYRERVEREAQGLVPNANWKARWRRSLESLEESFENPAYIKKIIRELRREAGLAVWEFMY